MDTSGQNSTNFKGPDEVSMIAEHKNGHPDGHPLFLQLTHHAGIQPWIDYI